ncbi:MAG: CHAT domain-containing protein [Gemmatimonadaceae bacterium]|jgi:hypothetical protein|nr:CHAT domain-containing protein [Gemmatimonadaceae bacterium]
MARQQQFLDFAILVSPGTDNTYPVSITESPVGEVQGSLRFPFDSPTLERELEGLASAIIAARSATPGAASRAEPTMRGIAMADETPAHAATVTAFGRTLFAALFEGAVGAAFKTSKFAARKAGKGLRVRLRIEAPELAALPWEFLYDPESGDFVCLLADTPLVRYLQVDRPMNSLTVQPPIRVLAMVSSPSDHDRLDVAQERRRVDEATAGLRAAGLLEVVWMESATVDALQKALRTGVYHVFHFVGHGGFDATRGKGVLIFTDEQGKGHVLDAAMAARILSREDTLRLVVLNACLGSKGSASDLFSSTAATLVRGGVPAVVGMQYEISDAAAIQFARTLYDSLGDGFPIDAAVAEARVKLSTETGSVEWGTPVLHMLSPDGVLFEIDGMTTSEARNTGRYNQVIPRPAATPTPAPAPPVTEPPPAPPPTPAVEGRAAPPPVAAAPSVPKSSGGWRNVALGAVGALVVVIMAVYAAMSLSGDAGAEGTVADSAFADTTTAVADSTVADSAMVDGWIVGFESVQGGDHTWVRIDSTCRWLEMIVRGVDTTFADQYVQVSSTDTELELFNRDTRVTLVMPTSGGWVSVDSGGGRELVNAGIRVTRMLGAVPTNLPECESSAAP